MASNDRVIEMHTQLLVRMERENALRAKEGEEVAKIRPQDRAIIIPGENWKTTGYTEASDTMTQGRLLNVQHIIDTGQVDIAANVPGASLVGISDYTIDIDKNRGPDQAPSDAVNRALDSVQERVIADVKNSETMQALFKKESWSPEDRTAYEKELSETVNKEIDKVPGLDEYRTVWEAKILGLGDKAHSENTTNLNELSKDIVDHTHDKRFDCGVMATFEGIILQKVEQKLLPANQEGNMKSAHNYFLQTGSMDKVGGTTNALGLSVSDGDVRTSGSHIWIVSSATGGIIEATADPSDTRSPEVYNAPVNAVNGFQDRLEGKTAIILNNDSMAGIRFLEYDNTLKMGPMGGVSDAELGTELRNVMEKEQISLDKGIAESIKDLKQPKASLDLYVKYAGSKYGSSYMDDLENVSKSSEAAAKKLMFSDEVIDFKCKWEKVFDEHKNNPEQLQQDFKLLSQQLDKYEGVKLVLVSHDEKSMQVTSLKNMIGQAVAKTLDGKIAEKNLPDFMKDRSETMEFQKDPKVSANVNLEGTGTYARIDTTPPAPDGVKVYNDLSEVLPGASKLTVLSGAGDASVVASVVPAAALSVVVPQGDNAIALDQLQQQQQAAQQISMQQNASVSPSTPAVNMS